MLLAVMCLVSSFLSRTVTGGLDPLECCAFHCACALSWAFLLRPKYKRTLKGDDGLRVAATSLSHAQRAFYAAGCVLAYPILPHAHASAAFVLTSWYELSSVHSSNVAVLCCSFFVALSAVFDGFASFGTPLLATSISLIGHGALSHRIDADTHFFAAVVHAAAGIMAYVHVKEWNLQSVLIGTLAGSLFTADRILSATTLRNTKAHVQQACRVSFAICLVTLPLRFYSAAHGEKKLACLAEFLLVVSTFWFQSFASEWHDGVSALAPKPLGLAVVALVVIHGTVHTFWMNSPPAQQAGVR